MTIGFFPPDTNASAVTTLPTPAAPSTPGYFTDSGVGIPASVVSNDFLNGVVQEFMDLSTAGGIALSRTSTTMVPNILALIGTAGYVKKVGDTMTGNLTLGANYSTPTNTAALVVASGSSTLNVVINAPASAQNVITQSGDTLIWYTDGTANTGALTIAPYGSGSTGGIRLDSTGQVTVTRPFTASGGTTTTTLTASGAATLASLTTTGATSLASLTTSGAATLASLTLSGTGTINGSTTFNAAPTFVATPILNNGVYLTAKDTGGSTHLVLGYGSDNFVHLLSGTGGLAINNSAFTINTLLIDNSGNGTFAGTIAGANASASNQAVMLGQSFGNTTQVWQNVLASRAAYTWYPNATGRPIMVNVTGDSNLANDQIFLGVTGLGGATVNVAGQGQDPAFAGMFVSAVVPTGASYYVGTVLTGTLSLGGWSELR